MVRRMDLEGQLGQPQLSRQLVQHPFPVVARVHEVSAAAGEDEVVGRGIFRDAEERNSGQNSSACFAVAIILKLSAIVLIMRTKAKALGNPQWN
jgi:hypothetical protein